MKTLPNEADFFRFMQANGPQNDKSKGNYISWLRYVKDLYNPAFENFTKEDIGSIYDKLISSQNTREVYKSINDASNIRSALRKYLKYISSSDASTLVTDIELEIGEISTTSKTIIEARLGQGKYRKVLVEIWGKCAVTEFDRVDLLIASHIKPWKKSTQSERLDPYNGLLLNPTLDKLFDLGYISFDPLGKIILSPLLSDTDIDVLGISTSMNLYKIEEGCMPYLEYHRNEVLVHLK